MEELSKLRERWEFVPENTRKHLVTHFEPLAGQVAISIMVEYEDGERYFDVIRYFKLGDGWAVSCDLKSDDAFAAFEKLGRVLHSLA
jgi:hypothetical protein